MIDPRFAKGDRVVLRGTLEPVYEVTRADTSWPYVHVRSFPTEYQTDCFLESTLTRAPPPRRRAPAGSLLEDAIRQGAPSLICTSMHYPGKPAGNWTDADVCGWEPTYVRADRYREMEARADRLAAALRTVGAAIGRRADPDHIDGPGLDDSEQLEVINEALASCGATADVPPDV